MGAYYDEIEIEDMTWDELKKVYHYPCPCGDRFEISKGQLATTRILPLVLVVLSSFVSSTIL